MLFLTKKSGFASFAEIIVTSTIFLISAVGIYSTIAAITPQAASATRKLKAANEARSFIERLRAEVSADTWSNGGQFDVGRTYTNTTESGMQINYFFTEPTGHPAGQAPRILNLTVSY